MYPNAYNGIKKIYTAEILSLIAAIIGIIAAIAALAGVYAIDAGKETDGAIAALLGGGAIILISGILVIIAFIIQIIGISNASKDEPLFKKAMTWLIIGLVASIVISFLPEDSMETLDMVADLVKGIADIFVIMYVIDGVISLAKKIGKSSIAAKGAKIKNMIIVVYAIGLILTVIDGFMTENDTTVVISGVLGIIALIVMIAAYLMYLKLLSRAKKMLG